VLFESGEEALDQAARLIEKAVVIARVFARRLGRKDRAFTGPCQQGDDALLGIVGGGYLRFRSQHGGAVVIVSLVRRQVKSARPALYLPSA
jgi:hypothetical protein